MVYTLEDKAAAAITLDISRLSTAEVDETRTPSVNPFENKLAYLGQISVTEERSELRGRDRLNDVFSILTFSSSESRGSRVRKECRHCRGSKKIYGLRSGSPRKGEVSRRGITWNDDDAKERRLVDRRDDVGGSKDGWTGEIDREGSSHLSGVLPAE